jgi:hypothetical protein
VVATVLLESILMVVEWDLLHQAVVRVLLNCLTRTEADSQDDSCHTALHPQL